MMNIHNRNERKEAKALYNQPIRINSKYAFNIKNRDFKIKKYMNYWDKEKNEDDQINLE